MKSVKSLSRVVGFSALIALPLAAFAGADHIVANQLSAAAETNAQPTPSAPVAAINLMESVKAHGNFNTWLTALEAAGFTDTLTNKGPYTLFAPTDEAFAKLPPGKLHALLQDKAQLKALIDGHIVNQKLTANDLPRDKVKTLSGNSVKIDMNRSHKIYVDKAKIVFPDIVATNGVIHGVDKVILTN